MGLYERRIVLPLGGAGDRYRGEQNACEIRVDGQRLWNTLMTLGSLGETAKGGSRRLALTELDRAGRALLIQWMVDAAMTVTWDELGNIFGRRAGRNNELAPVMTGSHIDTQPSGGKFDGCFGVIAGLEVVRTLEDAGIVTEAPIELAIWTNEEGARFVPTMMGSAVFAGGWPLQDAWDAKDAEGKTVRGELEKIGFLGSDPVGNRPVGSYLEAHIEQGPVLETSGNVIGVVTGVLGIRLIDVTVTGQEAHAGPTPMAIRKDALYAAAPLFNEIVDLAKQFAPMARATVGEVVVSPGVRNTIPGQVRFSVDLRHLDTQKIQVMVDAAKAACQRAQEKSGLTVHFEELQDVVPTRFDEDMVELVRSSTRELGYPFENIVSGAGHDACNMAKIVPTAMIFVPCRDGISHNEVEFALPEHLEAGANVLLHAMLKRAGL